MQQKTFLKSVSTANWIIYSLFLLCYIYFCYLIIFTTKNEGLWNFFPDSNDYITQSKSSLLSLDFYSPKPAQWFSPRPFTIPLFIKFAGSDPFTMLYLQRCFYCVCVLVLVLVLSCFITNNFLKIIFQLLMLYFFTMWEIVGWSNNVVSEFMSTSLMFLWFAIIILYYKKPDILRFIGLIIVSILLSFTRDTWPYIILVFAVLNFIVFKLQKKHSKLNVVFLAFAISIFLVQNITSNIGERYKLPVFNSIVGRVAQNDEYLAWFKERGMPITDSIVKDFRGIDVDSETGRSIIYKKYQDSLYAKLFEWVKKDGKSYYTKFVVTHPDYFFMMDQTTEQVERIFCTKLNRFGYYQYPEGFFLYSDGFFPFFNIWICLLLTIGMAIIFKLTRDAIYIFPLLLVIMFTVNVMLSYNADTLEVNRHLYTTQIIVEFICFISIPYLIDQFIKRIRNKKEIAEKESL